MDGDVSSKTEFVALDGPEPAKPLRVAMLTNLFSPVVSGSSTHVQGLARSLAAQGHHCIVITAHVDPAVPSHEAIDGYEVYRIPALHLPKMKISLNFPWLNWVFWPSNVKFVEGLIKKHNIDIIHVHNHMFDMAFIGASIKRRLRIPMILTLHTLIKHSNPIYNAVLTFFDRYLLGPVVVRHADEVISPDNNMKTYLENRFGVLNSALINYGVEPPCDVSEDEVDDIRKLYKLEGSKVIVSVGHVHAIRDRHELLRALPMVIEKVPNVKFLVVGGVFSQAPIELARKLGISERIIFAGPQEHSRIWAFLKLADVEAHWLNQSEGTMASPGLASMEAMYAGLPVVTISNETIYGPGILEDGGNIVLIQREQISALAERLCELLTKPELACSIGKRAAETCERHFSWPRIAERTAAVYRAVVQSVGRR